MSGTYIEQSELLAHLGDDHPDDMDPTGRAIVIDRTEDPRTPGSLIVLMMVKRTGTMVPAFAVVGMSAEEALRLFRPIPGVVQ